MSDQAQGLRALAGRVRGEAAPSPLDRQAPSHETCSLESDPDLSAIEPTCPDHAVVTMRTALPRRTRTSINHARVVAITSGKGGVGKSNFSANLSIALGQRGKRVVLLDADIGLANAHILLGAAPKYGLDHVIAGTKSIREVLHGVSSNVQLVGGGSGISRIGGMSAANRSALLQGMSDLDSTCDLMVIDTGAGVEDNVLAFLCAVNEVIVVTTPEPTAIANAYATIKVVSQQNRDARLMLVVNMVNSSGEGAGVADRLNAITRQFLDREVEYAGCIPLDPAVPRAVRSRTPFVSSAPRCAAAIGIDQIVRRLGLVSSGAPKAGGMDAFVASVQRYFRRSAMHSAGVQSL